MNEWITCGVIAAFIALAHMLALPLFILCGIARGIRDGLRTWNKSTRRLASVSRAELTHWKG